MSRQLAAVLSLSVCLVMSGASARAADPSTEWADELVRASSAGEGAPAVPMLKLIRQDHEHLEFGQSVIRTPLTLGNRRFEHGLGTHSVSHVSVSCDVPIRHFTATVGVDHNPRTAGLGSVVFTVAAGEKELYRSKTLKSASAPESVDIEVPDAGELSLHVTDAGDGVVCDHADWAQAQVILRDGRRFWLDELPLAGATVSAGRYPFSFTYAGKPAHQLLDRWKRQDEQQTPAREMQRQTITWDDPQGALRVTWQITRYANHPAAEWMLFFENRGNADTEIIEQVQAMDLTMRSPLGGETRYRLYRTRGGPAGPADFEPSTVTVNRDSPQVMTAGQGRSSSQCFPFFKLETGRGSLIVAVGWSGMWKSEVTCPDDRQLHVTAGLEKTRFRLHPGERVRSPRMLALAWCGDTWEANAQFRRLISEHYAARRTGKVPQPMLFCNTCFTRGGGWLNECTAENQISLINAYAPLGLEAILTDAGWFEGGWPAGAGNWNPRKDAYPDGMGPVAAAAKARGMIYGLWFEPERVVAGTWLHRNRPEWLLHSRPGDQDTYLLNFGRPEVQKYFFEIVKGFMDLPGFRFYRQDFNMDPLPYWRFSDAADRQGVTEMKYIEGLYAYWDNIARTWPDSVREECASGGNRIDLETVLRMHLHQKTDYWFNNEVDQASLWGLSQYLPNNVVVAHLNRMDDYSFHSTLASSLCMGWIADAPDFDAKRGKQLMDRYLAVRHLLTGAWYPLLPYSRDADGWTGSQFHRGDLDEGLLLIFRRAQSPYRTVDVQLRGVNADHTYEMEAFGLDGARRRMAVRGADLLKGINLTLPAPHASDLIVYRKIAP